MRLDPAWSFRQFAALLRATAAKTKTLQPAPMSQDPTPLATADVEAAAELAAEHHRAGRLEEAQRLYSAILSTEPRHARAAHNLGALYLSRKQIDRGLPLLAIAADAEPRGGQAWITYAQALIVAGQFETAERLIGARAEAAPAALKLRLCLAWGAGLMRGGELDSAELQFRRARDIAPQDLIANAELGHVLLRLGRTDAAISVLEQAERLAPGDLEILLNLGSALKALRRHDEAEARYRQALTVQPRNPAAVRNLGILLVEAGRCEEALALADETLAGDGDHPEGLMLRGAAFYGQGRYDEALESYSRAARLDGSRYEALTKVGAAEAALGRYPDALTALNAAVALRPEDPLALSRRAFIRLLLGDFEGGWRDYEARWRWEGFDHDITPQIRARLDLDIEAEDLSDRNVLVIAEQGIGDKVMFASMIPDLAATARQVTCACESRLVGLFSNSFKGVSVVDPNTVEVRLSGFDKVVPMGSLARIYRNRLQDFPATPYLRPREAVRERWMARLGARPRGLRIGVSWRGGTPRTGQAGRSLALTELAPILGLPGCEIVSLQYGDVREEVEAANATLKSDIRMFPREEIDDFEELAGLLTTLDVVVSVQTAVAHLAGALGTECMVMIPQNPEWRYTARASTMPWYGSVRLFRQSQPKSWDSVLGQVVEALQSRLASPTQV
jgi:tetratricopeptide (TPR) repeat protein